MEVISEKLCIICLSNNCNTFSPKLAYYEEFFIHVLQFKNLPETISMCIWCEATLKRTLKLINLAKETQAILKLYNKIKYPKSKTIYNLGYSNNYIEIQPENINDTLYDSENEENETNNEKNLKDNELKFEIKYLSVDEQKDEIKQELAKLVRLANVVFKCDDCGKGFVSSGAFEEHKMKHSDTSGLHKCDICNLRFSSHGVLLQHNLAHKRRFTCVICGAVFKRWNHCKMHRYKCGNTPNYVPCDICCKIFSDENSLYVHKRIHKERKYTCDHCNVKFLSKNRLEVHIRTHTGAKPFECGICNRKFSTNSNLRAHYNVHEGKRQHYCVECNTYYKTEKGLKKHFRESPKHNKDRMYKCTECLKSFITDKLLLSHREKHTKSYNCDLCKKVFSNNSNLKKHIKTAHVT